MVVLFYVVLLINIILAICKKKSSSIIIFTYILLIFMMIGNIDGPDVKTYQFYYIQASNKIDYSGDFGYYFIEYICGNFLQLNFFEFRFLLSVVCFLLIHKTFTFFDINEHMQLAMYMGYPVFIDIIQIRNFVGTAIFLYSIKYLISDKKKHNTIYVLLVLAAASFHIIFAFGFVFLVYKLKNKKLINRMIVMSGVILFGVTYYLRSSLFVSISKLILGERGSGYFSGQTHYSFLGVLAIYLFNMYMIYYMKKEAVINCKDTNKYVSYCWKLNCCLIIFIPLCLVSINFYRIIRNMYTFNTIYYGYYFQYLSKRGYKKQILLLMMIILVVLWYIFDYILLNDYELIIPPIFENNIFWGQDKNWSLFLY